MDYTPNIDAQGMRRPDTVLDMDICHIWKVRTTTCSNILPAI